MSEVFFISDTHFGHKNILTFHTEDGSRYRPFDTIEEHDEALIENWNKMVSKDDLIWHLGDICFHEKIVDRILPRLNGRKKLVLGNHDRVASEVYLKYFEKLYGVADYHGFLLSHIPVVKAEKSRFKGNIHGHMHRQFIDDPWYLSVCVEQIGYFPVSFEYIKKIFEERKENERH